MGQSRTKVWTKSPARPEKPDASEKQAIVAACEGFIADVLKPRFLPQVVPTQWNYPVDIRGAWSGGRYRFIQRYRSGFEHNMGEEFDAPFARIDRMGPDNFDIYWMRHTGQWWKLYSNQSLKSALTILQSERILHPN